jgi:uncharacterized membrane protein YoaK (UPF0700 family)
VKRLRDDQPRMHLVMMLTLTFSTGIVDAVGYLGLDRVFTANMTGNVVILGMAIAQADGLPILGPVIALLTFLLGAALGGRLLRGARVGWSGRSTVTFSSTGVLLVGLGAASFVVTPEEGTPWAYTVTGLLGLAMGLQAASARRLAVADVTTIVVTSTIVGLASDSRLAGGDGTRAGRRVLAVLAILAGAAVGALLLNVHIGVGMAVAGGLTMLVALAGHLLRARRAELAAAAEAAAAEEARAASIGAVTK